RDDQFAMNERQRAPCHDQAAVRGAREDRDAALDLGRGAHLDGRSVNKNFLGKPPSESGYNSSFSPSTADLSPQSRPQIPNSRLPPTGSRPNTPPTQSETRRTLSPRHQRLHRAAPMRVFPSLDLPNPIAALLWKPGPIQLTTGHHILLRLTLLPSHYILRPPP